jgi:hypothetical protein
MTYSTRRTLLADMARFTAALPLIDWSRDVAQQRMPRIGFMSGGEPSLISSFEDEMRRLGYSPGQEHPYRNDRRQYVGTWEPAAIGAVTAPTAVWFGPTQMWPGWET